MKAACLHASHKARHMVSGLKTKGNGSQETSALFCEGGGEIRGNSAGEGVPLQNALTCHRFAKMQSYYLNILSNGNRREAKTHLIQVSPGRCRSSTIT